jgi:hypothetical protein
MLINVPQIATLVAYVELTGDQRRVKLFSSTKLPDCSGLAGDPGFQSLMSPLQPSGRSVSHLRRDERRLLLSSFHALDTTPQYPGTGNPSQAGATDAEEYAKLVVEQLSTNSALIDTLRVYLTTSRRSNKDRNSLINFLDGLQQRVHQTRPGNPCSQLGIHYWLP